MNYITDATKKKLLGLLGSRAAVGEASLKTWGQGQSPRLTGSQAEEIADALVAEGLATTEERTSGRIWRAVTRKPEPPPIEVTTRETPGETPTPTENDVELVEMSEEAEVLSRPASPKGVTPGLGPDGLPHPEAPVTPLAGRDAAVTPEPTPAPAPITPASRPVVALDDLTEEQLVALLAARRAETRAREELVAFEQRVAGERVAIEARLAAARAAWEAAARGEAAAQTPPPRHLPPRPTPVPAPAAPPEGLRLRDRVLDLFQLGHELRGAYVATELGVTVGQASPVISRLVAEGALERIDRGVYRLARGKKAA